VLRREDSEGGDEALVSLYDVPEAPGSGLGEEAGRGVERRRKQPARDAHVVLDEDDEAGGAAGEGDRNYVVVDSEDEDGDESASSAGEGTGGRPSHRSRKRGRDENEGAEQPTDGPQDGGEKKKVAMDISYEGFAIYGRVLCLVVKRRGNAGGRSVGAVAESGAAASSSGSGRATAQAAGNRGAGAAATGGGQARMENWIASTQMTPAAEQADEG
jgi:hypothetical protein